MGFTCWLLVSGWGWLFGSGSTRDVRHGGLCRTRQCRNPDSREAVQWELVPASVTVLEFYVGLWGLVHQYLLELAVVAVSSTSDQAQMNYNEKKLQSYVKEKSFSISETGALSDKLSPAVLRSLVTLTDKSK